MRLKFLIFILTALTLVFSCARKVETGYASIRLVDRMVSDSLPALHRLASEAGKTSGTIVLVGEPMRCVALSEKMLSFDEFDNVDARPVKDGLPDFAGETIVSLMDFTYSPYDSLRLEGTDSLFFRELAIKGALAALDSSLGCKVLVICSPRLAGQGGADVVDFYGRIGCGVSVISSADTSFSFPAACFKVMREKNLFTHDIAYPQAKLMMVSDGIRSMYPSVTVFDENLVPAAFADTVGVFAPDTYVSHVQNKHNPGRNR